MGRVFSAKQVFTIALGVGLAIALAPMMVEAASNAVGLSSTGNRKVAVSKRGVLSVAVRGKPKVAVPDGVSVTGPVTMADGASVKVPDGVAVTNQPTVTVANQPTRLDVRPALDNLVHGYKTTTSLDWSKLLEAPSGKQLVVTSITATSDTYTLEANRNYATRLTVNGGNSATCGGSIGLQELRRIVVTAGETVTLDLSSAPIVVAAGDAPACLGIQVWVLPNNVNLSFAADGYTIG